MRSLRWPDFVMSSLGLAAQVPLCALIGIMFWGACGGVGLSIVPRPPQQLVERADDSKVATWRQMGVAACVGLGALMTIGGIAVAVGVPWWLYVPPFLVVGLVLTYRHSRSLSLDAGGRSLMTAFVVAALVAFALVAGVESLVGLRFPLNACDDLRAYLPMARRLLATSRLDEPWSLRRVQSLGGFDLLRALPVAVFGDAGVGVAETAIASIFLAGLFVATEVRSRWAALLRILFIVAIPFLWVPRANTTGVLFGTPLIVAVLATTTELRGALRSRQQRTAVQWALAGALLIAALMSVRPNLGFFAAVVVAAGCIFANATVLSRRMEVLAAAGAGVVLAIVPWSIAMWRTVGTPLYPLLNGNLNASAVAEPAVQSLTRRTQDALDVARAGPYLWVALAVLVVALLMRTFLIDAALIALSAAVVTLVTFAFAFSSPLIGAQTFARYNAPMSQGLAVFLVCEVLRSADANRRPELGVRLSQSFALGAAILVAAAAFSTLGMHSKGLLPSGNTLVRLVERNKRFGSAIDPGLQQAYDQALASLGGQRAIAAVDRPYLIDYSRHDIPSLDMPGLVTPDRTFPYFTGPGPKIAKLRAAGFKVLLVTNPTDEPCLGSARLAFEALAVPARRAMDHRLLDWESDINEIQQRVPQAIRRYGPILRIDLAAAQESLRRSK